MRIAKGLCTLGMCSKLGIGKVPYLAYWLQNSLASTPVHVFPHDILGSVRYRYLNVGKARYLEAGVTTSVCTLCGSTDSRIPSFEHHQSFDGGLRWVKVEVVVTAGGD